MIKVKIDSSGIKDTFGDIQKQFEEGLKAGLTEVAKQIELQAKRNAPANTGALRNSIQSDVEMNGTSGSAKVFSDVEYAIYVHEGTGIYSRTGMGRKDVPWRYQDQRTGQWYTTSGIQATPFLEDAENEIRPEVAKIIGDEITKRLGG